MGDELKAFAIHGDEWSEIVFARHRITAIRCVASEHNDNDIGGLRSERVRWADQYAPGPVPIQVRLEHGWWAECSCCYARVSADGYTNDDGDEVESVPVYDRDNVWCSAECQKSQQLERAERKAAEAAALADYRARLLAKIPDGLTLTGNDHVYVSRGKGGPYIPHQIWIAFRFPGCAIGDAHFRIDKPGEEPYVTVCGGDLAAWEAWRATQPEGQPS